MAPADHHASIMHYPQQPSSAPGSPEDSEVPHHGHVTAEAAVCSAQQHARYQARALWSQLLLRAWGLLLACTRSPPLSSATVGCTRILLLQVPAKDQCRHARGDWPEAACRRQVVLNRHARQVSDDAQAGAAQERIKPEALGGCAHEPDQERQRRVQQRVLDRQHTFI